jgi:hypothetical protein
MLATIPRAMTSRFKSAVLTRDSGKAKVRGNSHARAFTATTTEGGKLAGPPPAGLLFKPGQAFVEKTLTPLAHDLSGRIEALSDLLVRQALSGIQNDLRTNDVDIR